MRITRLPLSMARGLQQRVSTFGSSQPFQLPFTRPVFFPPWSRPALTRRVSRTSYAFSLSTFIVSDGKLITAECSFCSTKDKYMIERYAVVNQSPIVVPIVGTCNDTPRLARQLRRLDLQVPLLP